MFSKNVLKTHDYVHINYESKLNTKWIHQEFLCLFNILSIIWCQWYLQIHIIKQFNAGAGVNNT